ncbi:MAG: PstS family phosphate ABC transporter substrate-binding protein [Thermomicrobiales bacterium]
MLRPMWSSGPARAVVGIAASFFLLTALTAPLAAAQDEVVEPENAAELAALTGEVLVDGSSTVYPVTQAAAEEFAAYAPEVQVSVGISGTGGGFERFCNGETDISDASRPIDPDEAALCAENGIEFIEIPVAYDGLSVLVNPANDWAACLTVEELNTIWAPESEGQVTNWNQVRADFPDAPLNLYGAGTDSGTFDYFTQAINGDEGASRGDFQASEDDNILVQGIAGDPNAIGFFGYSYYVANQDALKLVAVDDAGDGDCVEPSPETITDASYQPLSRPIFIYVKAASAERPEVAAFVEFYLSQSFTPIIDSPEVGYVELAPETYAAVGDRFASRTTGTLFPDGAEVGATLDRYLDGAEAATPAA